MWPSCCASHSGGERTLSDSVANFDLPLDHFPFVIEYFTADGTVVHSAVVTGPGVMQVPPLAATHGPIGTRVSFATGHVVTQDVPD